MCGSTKRENIMNTVTQAHIDQYNEIRKTQGDQAAQNALREVMASLGFNATERMHAWDALKAASYAEAKAAVKSEKSAKRAVAATKPSINKTCIAVLAHPCLTSNERKFLEDVKTCRKLTVKQNAWLLDLAKKAKVEIKGEFDVKEASFVSCDHADLGSLGYAHGSIVKCPHCGQRAEVW